MIPAVQLQKALYKSLSQQYRVNEVIPKEPIFPFFSLGQIDRTTNFTKTDRNRYDFAIYIHGWSKGLSSLEIKTMEHYANEQINKIDVEGFIVENVALSLSTTITEKSGENNIFHSVQEFLITINTKGE